VDRSISQGRPATGGPDPEPPVDVARDHDRSTVRIGLAIVLLLLGVYALSNPHRINFYNHFVWQADAWLEGQASIRYPVLATPDSPGNDYFQDVMPLSGADGLPTGRGLIPFPPLPAVVLLPFVAVLGLGTDAQLIATVLAALVVGVAFWMLGRLPVDRRVRIATTVFFGLGTVFWYAAALGSTWYLAHVVAVGLTLLAIGIALDADPAAMAELDGPTDPGGSRASRQSPPIVDGRQLLAGLLFGLACTSRLTVVFGAPFFLFVGGGGSWPRRGLSAGLGAAIPIVALLAYNVSVTGHPLHPAYEYLYRLEAVGWPFLHYNLEWAIEDPRYLPQNLALMLGGLPDVMPACDPGALRGIFDEACQYVVPNPIGMSILLTSPGWLLAIPALRDYGRSRVVTGAVLAIFAIAAVNLMHFSQGWVQFGYRFSNDFAPFALLLVALGIQWLGGARRRFVVVLIALSVVVNAWGVAWGMILGW
jgi:hypothetical protein